MPDLSRFTPRRLAAAGLRRLAAPARLREARAELEAHRARVADLQGHIEYLEGRVHQAEYRLNTLDEFGLVEALSHDPASFARWLTWRPPGHFYSTVPNLYEIERHADHLWNDQKGAVVAGIDLREEAQLELFDRVTEIAPTCR